jgi:hypothetical protein
MGRGYKKKDKKMNKNFFESDLDYMQDGDCKLPAGRIVEDFSNYFKTRDRFRDGERVGFDRLFISIKAEARDWIRDLGLTGDCVVFGLGDKNITFVSQDNKVFYNSESGARALEYVKAWIRLLDKNYGAVEIFTTDILPTGARTTRGGGKKIKTLDDLMESALRKTDDRDYGI